MGYGGNQKRGYQYFIDKDFDVVILLHGDGQYAPEVISDLYTPIVRGQADAVFGSRMMRNYGGPLKGGMPLYKYIGNRILTSFENKALSMRLTEFHSGYRAYNLHALKQLKFDNMTNDFHFDTEIIIKLQHQRMTIMEVPIPTYYGDEICYVNGMKYAKDVFFSVLRYKQTINSICRHPEFTEYFINYPLKRGKFSSHYFFQKLVGHNQNVLDIGCGEGFFAALISKTNRVTGVDMLKSAVKNEHFENYISADLNQGLRGIEFLQGKSYDKVLLQDILEHLQYPDQLLKHCYDVLAANGDLIVSIPNVANITVRISLLLGNWNYSERGILDQTHLRFYTHKSGRKLLERNGFKVIRQLTTVMPIELVLGLPPENILLRFLNYVLAIFTKIMPGLLGYQCIYVARKKK